MLLPSTNRVRVRVKIRVRVSHLTYLDSQGERGGGGLMLERGVMLERGGQLYTAVGYTSVEPQLLADYVKAIEGLCNGYVTGITCRAAATGRTAAFLLSSSSSPSSPPSRQLLTI